jgi:cyclopropane-fatty-acyl-phospholipid synthase
MVARTITAPAPAGPAPSVEPAMSDHIWRAVLRRLGARLKVGRLTVDDPRGVRHTFDAGTAGPSAAIQFHRMRAIRRLVTGGVLGFAEAYIDGEWESPDLVELIRFAVRNEAALGATMEGAWPLRFLARLWHLSRANTRRGSARNISHHYDLGNAFYAAWLDAEMNYSSAIFSRGDETLEVAQRAKIARIVELAGVRADDRVLEIGCGWGALAEELVRRHGCRVTGITLSHEQLAYARNRLSRELSHGMAELQWLDYRDTQGTYDRIVSIEMLEAVGQENWPTYFDILHRRLKPGGRAVLQVITIADERFEEYARGADFIQRYIFPGGLLPSRAEIRAHAAAAGLILRSEEMFGASYARTLGEWRQRFQASWTDVKAMGFDQRFRRMWEYYLAYCEAGFREQTIDVGLYVLERPLPKAAMPHRR